MRKLVLVGAVLLAATGCGTDAPSAPPAPAGPTTFTIHGKLTLDGSLLIVREPGEVLTTLGPIKPGTPCAGSGGFTDIASGAEVTVSVGSAVKALGSLSAGQVDTAMASSHDKGDGTCRFTFVISNVPAGADFYSVEVGHRGAINYSASDAASTFGVDMKLG